MRSAPRRLGPVVRPPAGGFQLGIWWVAASGVGLLLLACASLAVSLVGSVRVLAAGAILLALAGVAAPLPQRVRPRTALVTGTGATLVLIGGLQLAVPAFMEARMRSGLSGMGDVQSVDVGSFPAVKMLWGDVDRAELHIGEMDARKRKPSGVFGGDLLGRIRNMGSLEVTIGRLKAGPLSAEHVEIDKRGDKLRAKATVAPTALSKMLSGGAPGIEAKPKVVDGQLRFRMSGDQLPGPITVLLFAQDGQIMSQLKTDEKTAQALGLPPGQEAPPQPMFANDKLSVDSLKVREAGDRLVIDADARLADEQPVA